MTSFIVMKNQGETWRDCVVRISRKFGVEDECVPVFDSQVDGGIAESEAAWNALFEWDCIETVDVEEEED